MKIMKRTTAWLMTILLIMSILPSSLMLTAFASEFVDFPTGWSAEAVQAAVDNGLLHGKGNGRIEPQARLTRAEAAAVINRAFGSTVKADISSFTDVSPSDWYYDDFAKAVNMKSFVGDGNGHLNPNDNITREELFTVVARALVLSDYDTAILSRFNDSADVSDYAMSYLAALVKNEYINGNADGTMNPKGLITREEFAQMMHNTFKTYISTSGTVTSVDGQDSVMIRVPNVTLKDVTIEKDLVLGDGVGAGDVTLVNVTIKGRLLCRGGEGYVDLVDTTVGDKVVVYDVNGIVNFHNYETEEPFEGHVQHTPATFLKKTTTSGGGGSSSSSREYRYEIQFHIQSNMDTPDTVNPNYVIMTDWYKQDSDRRNKNIELDWNDIEDIAEEVIPDWQNIKVTHIFDEEKSERSGKNDGNLTLNIYLKKKIFTVTGPDGTVHKYFYDNQLNANEELLKYIEDYEKEQESKGYNVTWKDEDGNIIDDTYKIKEHIKLVTVLTPITYTIDYVTNGGSEIPQGTYTVETETFDLPVPTKAGFFFAGWYENEDLSGDRIKNIEKGTIGNKTFYAKWADDELSFDATVSGDTVTVAVKLTNIPSDIKDLASIDINYTYDDAKVTYVNTVSNIGDTLAATAGNIAWNGASALTALPADGTLFTITFTKKAGATGVAEFEFDDTELLDSEYTESLAYAKKGDSVDFGDDPGPVVTKANLSFVATKNGDAVTVNVVLDKIPADIKDLSSIDIDYTFDNAKLAYKDTVSAIGDTLSATSGNIAWNGTLTAIPTDGVLFTITFDVLEGATGETEFVFGTTELMDSEYNESSAYTKENGKVDLGTPTVTDATLKFVATKNGDAVTVNVVLDKIPADIKDLSSIDIDYTFDNAKLAYKDTVSAIGDTLSATSGNIAWNGTLTAIPTDGVLFTITFDVLEGATGETEFVFGTTELMDSEYNESSAYTKENGKVDLGDDTFYTVKLYRGVEKDSNYKGIIENIPANTCLSETDIYGQLGSLELYKMEGYTNSDGEVHYIYPTLMYNNGGVWEEFDIANTAINQDLSLCLLNRTLSITVNNDSTIKGYEIPEIIIELPYDDESAVGESVLDAMTIFRTKLSNVLYTAEEKGVDLYAELIARLSSKGITDSQGNILPFNVTLNMADFISAREIEGKIDEYIKDGLKDDEFIASILENDAIVKSLIDNEDIKKSFMNNTELRDKLLSDEEFIKDMAKDSTIVDAIIDSESFKLSFIENDATIQYILSDAEIKQKILENEDFRKILIDECVKFVIDVYFEGNTVSESLFNYIDEVLQSREFIDAIEQRADELKEIFEVELKNLIKNADGNVKDEIFAEIRDENSELRAKLIDAIMTDDEIKEYIKAEIRDDAVFKASIKTAAQDNVKDNVDFKAAVKDWVLQHVKSDVDLQDKFIGYIMSSDVKYELMLENGVDLDTVDEYRNGTLDDALKQQIDDEIKANFISNAGEICYDYFDDLYDACYDTMYEELFDKIYEDDTVFGYAYDAFAAERTNFEDAFDAYIGDGTLDNTNIENAYQSFVDNDTAFHDFYESYVGNAERFNRLFESYYSTNVHTVASEAYNNADLKDLVMDYVYYYTEDLALEYAEGKLSENGHDELVTTIEQLMEEDIPVALRNAYKTDSNLKIWIDSMIESHADALITKYINNELTTEEKPLVDEAISDYADTIANSYVDGTIDSYTKGFVDDAVETYVESIVDDFVNNVNRDQVREFIVEYAEDAINAYKQTDAYKNLIEGFKNGKIIINADNLLLVRAIAAAVDGYTYEQIKNEFIDLKYHRFIDLIGDEFIKKYVDAAKDGFVNDLTAMCDNLEAVGTTDSTYTYPAAFSLDVDWVNDILYPVYNKAMNKVRTKLENTTAIKYSENKYLEKLANSNLLDEILFDKSVGTDGKNVYKIKSDILGMYDAVLEKTVLAHDALVWYNTLDDSEVDSMTAGAAAIFAAYANKLNSIIMNYIDNGVLPGDLTLQDILDFNGRIEEFYNKYETQINKALDKYEQYMDQDYDKVFDKLATGSIVAEGESFKITDIAIENKVFTIDAMFDAIFGGNNFADNANVQKIVNKLRAAQYTPVDPYNVKYYVDAYKATADNREFRGYSTGNTTIDVQRYLQ